MLTISFLNTWSFQADSNSMQNCAPTPRQPNAGLSNSQGSGVTPKPCQLSVCSTYKNSYAVWYILSLGSHIRRFKIVRHMTSILFWNTPTENPSTSWTSRLAVVLSVCLLPCPVLGNAQSSYYHFRDTASRKNNGFQYVLYDRCSIYRSLLAICTKCCPDEAPH